MTRAPAIDDYLAKASADRRALLRKVRETIHALIPEVEECISYRLPAFRYRGRIVAGFSATSKGCSYYPFSGKTLKTLASDLVRYSRTKRAKPAPFGTRSAASGMPMPRAWKTT